MALTGKTIGQLDHLTSSLTGDEAFPIQYNGATYHISQSQIVSGLATTGSNQFNGNQTIIGSLIQGLGNAATGENSHAEGDSTQAIGLFSHAEGLGTIAYGGRSHAEGQDTIASGSYSHAEGYQTIALADHQHVQGQFNATSSVPAAFIVGNGTDDSNRSNLIYAVGNEVQISGSLIVNGGITGSLFGTSSWANNAITASSADNFTVRGTLTAQTIVAQTITSSTDFVTGSTRFGSLLSNTHQFTGSVSITGSGYFSGNVGIGTTSPQKPLEAISATNDFVSVGVNQIADEAWTGIHFGYREANNLYRKSAIVFQRTDLTENNAQGKVHILNGPQSGAGNATLSDARLTIGESGNVGIGTTTPSAKLDVNGNTIITGSLTVITGSNIEFQVLNTGVKIGNAITDTHTVTGSFSVSGSLTVTQSLNIDSASLQYQQNLAVATGSFQTIASVATGSYRCAFFDYVTFSGSTVRAGTLVSTWSGSVTEYYENYTADLGGSTSIVILQTAISGSNIILQAGISGSAWSVRSLVRLL
jgi:hypothetical protein